MGLQMHIRTLLLAFAALALPAFAPAQDADLAAMIRAGDRDAALAAIAAGADVNAKQGDGSTPLHWAVYKVDHELTRALVKAGADPDVRSQLGALPLAEAANLADAELVSILLKARADPNLANQDGQTPLMLAARTGSVPVGQLLLKAGADVNAREQWREQTALMWAVGGRHAEFADMLIRKGADIEARAAVNDWGNQVTSEPRAQYRFLRVVPDEGEPVPAVSHVLECRRMRATAELARRLELRTGRPADRPCCCTRSVPVASTA